ncbi:dynamin family protein [Rubrivirga sp. S365]|uniref:dynamin family protein n=1 Tax=Rubrivirga sp. S365 TaxID=3076080 RepID=UPI0028C57D6B|nr:dynamin family protein [Rubrivirga sp. S365]MDT7857733.1 dynamin family protein [Rubrivirga sp. S365]
MDSPARSAHAFLDRERGLLAALGALLDRAAAPEPTRRRTHDLAQSLDELFLLVVAGEFNAGKSTLVNALFGRRVMEEGPVPTTDKITVLRYGEADETHRRGDFVTERTVTAPLLEGLALVDTPGTNSIVLEHQALTEDFIPRADLVLFVTSYDRPLSESERQFLTYVRGDWGKQLVVALNKADLADTEAALAQVVAHVQDGLRGLLRETDDGEARRPAPQASPGATAPPERRSGSGAGRGGGEGGAVPLVFPVAARLALAAKLDAAPPTASDAGGAGDVRTDPRWEASRFGPLERFLTETLTDDARLALKLAAPLDATRALVADARARLEAQRGVLADDEAGLAALDGRFAEVRDALSETVGRAVADVDRELLELETRGVRFLDDAIRVSRLNLLRDRNAFREEFARQVTRDADRRVEARLGEAADAVLRRVFELWNETYARLADLRRDRTTDGGGFLYDRDEVLRDVLREARRTVDQYDMHEEARRLLENARAAITVGGVTAAGIGTLAVVLIAATAFDVTGGVVLAGALATLGFVVLPVQRRRAVRDFTDRVRALRADLEAGLRRELDAEADEAVGRVRRLVEPVAEVVAASRTSLDAALDEADRITAEAAALRADVEAAFGAPLESVGQLASGSGSR